MTTVLHVEKSKRPSSPEKRAAAKAKLSELLERIEENKAAKLAAKDWPAPLLAAARFVVDVNGDPPSIDQLREAVENAERHQELSGEYGELHTTRRRLAPESHYYQWQAGEVNVIGGALSAFFVLGEGDTKKEAMEKARSRRR